MVASGKERLSLCASTELWAREVRYSSTSSIVARALQARDHDNCMDCLANGLCTHACCGAAWERIGLRNQFVKRDGQGDLIMSEQPNEASREDDPSACINYQGTDPIPNFEVVDIKQGF